MAVDDSDRTAARMVRGGREVELDLLELPDLHHGGVSPIRLPWVTCQGKGKWHGDKGRGPPVWPLSTTDKGGEAMNDVILLAGQTALLLAGVVTIVFMLVVLVTMVKYIVRTLKQTSRL